MFSKFSFIAAITLLLATIALPVSAQDLTGTVVLTLNSPALAL
jgi:hypothetical protein